METSTCPDTVTCGSCDPHPVHVDKLTSWGATSSPERCQIVPFARAAAWLGHGRALAHEIQQGECHQTWLAGKSPVTEWRFLARKITDFYGPFSSTPCLMTLEGIIGDPLKRQLCHSLVILSEVFGSGALPWSGRSPGGSGPCLPGAASYDVITISVPWYLMIFHHM